MAGYLNLRHGDVVDQARYYINQIETRELLPHKPLDAKVALVLFITARANKRPKCLPEILRYCSSSVTPSIVSKCLKKTKPVLFPHIDFRVNAEDIIDRVIYKIGYSEEVRQYTKHTARNLVDFTTGKPPKTVAAMALYMVR